MIEALVQWTLLNNPPELSSLLNFDISRIIGQEITTDFGRIDFVLANSDNKHLIVELETTLDNKAKLNYCFTQVLNYKNVKFSDSTNYCILYAEETGKNRNAIEEFGRENNILIQTYSLEMVKCLYTSTIEKLSLSIGLVLPNPKNYTICYLRWLNKIMKPFLDFGKDKLTNEEIFTPFDNPSKSRTNFNCYERIALDFELLSLENSYYVLTNYNVLKVIEYFHLRN